MIKHVIRFLFALVPFLSPASTSELYPYLGSHGSTKSARFVRECHAAEGRDETFEVAQQNDAAAPLQVKSFTDDVANSYPHRFAYGHLAVVANPRDTLSVYEPDHEGSCTTPLTTQHLLRESAERHNCEYAVNAGFFNVSTGNCLGNVISDGRLAVNGKGVMNPNFGVLSNGTIVVGYLTEEHIVGLDWYNLVQGIIWLVRDGKNYVESSSAMECADSQTTGDSLEDFVNAISARTAIGHDVEGNVVLVQVEGKTYSPRGIKLGEFADLLIAHGVINAVNLDGGSSSTVVLNNTLINYPSEHCGEEGGAYRCQHLISSILCVHAPCTCTPHGTCVNNKCECDGGYTGESCEEVVSCEGSCSDHGSCSKDGCVCHSGWVGSACHVPCPEGYYGNQCRQSCVCTRGTCNHVTGECACFSGWQGASCTSPCPATRWGAGCNSTCEDCTVHGSCDPLTGECRCRAGWQGRICQGYRGTTHFIGGLTTRELGVLSALIGLVASLLISISINVYYCLKSKSHNKPSYKQLRSSTSRGRSPRLPAAEISAKEHVQRQIPIYREIHSINQTKNDNSFRMDIKGNSITKEGKDVLEMIDQLQDEEDSFTDFDDTSLLLQR